MPPPTARSSDLASGQFVGNALQGSDPHSSDVIDHDQDILGPLGRLGLDRRHGVVVSFAGAPQALGNFISTHLAWNKIIPA